LTDPGHSRRKPVGTNPGTIRDNRSILRVKKVIWLVLVIVAVAVGLIIELSTTVRRNLARGLMDTTALGAELTLRGKFVAFFTPLSSQLAVASRWGEEGALDLKDQPNLNRIFMPVLEQYPQVISMLMANDLGREYMLLKENGTWLTRATDLAQHPGRVLWRHWLTADSLMSEWWEESDYDPRIRPWFTTALEERNADSQGVCLTPPYRFYTTGTLGVTLSKQWRPPGADVPVHVVGWDIPLSSILALTDSLLVEKGGLAWLINQEGRVFADPTSEPAPGTEHPPHMLGTRTPEGIEAQVIASWEETGREQGTPVAFTFAGQRWLSEIRSVNADSSAPWVAMAVPEASFLPAVRDRQHILVLTMLGLLLVGGLLTLLLTRVLRRPAALAGNALDLGSEDGLRRLIAQGEGDQLEFKSTLRWNLNTDKAGKEVEISWLKTVAAYLNSDGGVILIGLNDEGELLGLEADRFPSEDKFLLHFNNLIKQHIGLKFSRRIQADIRTVGEHRLFVIRCDPADDPVYLKTGKEERFYIRVGPSTRQLTMSEVVARFRKHGDSR